MKREKKNDDEEKAEHADDAQSEQPTETATEPETSLVSEQEPENKDETISSMSTQDFNQEKVEREFINLASHYKQIGESFGKLVKEVPHMKKHQLATHLVKMPILPMVKVTTEKKYHLCTDNDTSLKSPVQCKKSMTQRYMEKVLKESYQALSIVSESSLHYS